MSKQTRTARVPAPRMPAPGQARPEALAAAVIADIDAGRYPVGSALPTEAELQRRFAASRYAVREALRRIKDAGLVTSHPGIGTIVRTQRPTPRVVHVLGSLDDVLQLVRDTRVQRIGERDTALDAAAAERLRLPAGGTWHVFTLLRRAVGAKEPLALLRVHVRPEYASVGTDIDREQRPIFRLIEERYGERVVEVRQEVTAARMHAADARLLAARHGTPALRVLRQFIGAGGRVLLVSEGLYPEGRFALSNRLSLAPGSGA